MSKIAKNNINQKISQLEADIDWFYGEDFSLDQAADKYQSAIKLAKTIEQDLADLKNKIEVLSVDFTKE